MSVQDSGPSRKPKIKLPQPAKFSGEGDDLKPDRLKRWFREVKKYLSKHDVDDDTEDVVDYYGAFTEDRAHNAYLTLLDQHDEASPTLEQFKTRFKQLFEASTNTDDLYQKWQKVQQTTGGNPARISKIAGEPSAKKLLPHVYHTILPGVGGIAEYPYTSYPSGVRKLYLRVV